MATEDKRTKADLLVELEEAQRKIRQAKSEAYDAYQALPGRPPAVPEADALAGCIRALEALQETQRNTRTSYSTNNAYQLNYSDSGPRYINDVERILRTLAARYGVPLIEVRIEPCSRRHLDEINPDQIMSALHGGHIR